MTLNDRVRRLPRAHRAQHERLGDQVAGDARTSSPPDHLGFRADRSPVRHRGGTRSMARSNGSLTAVIHTLNPMTPARRPPGVFASRLSNTTRSGGRLPSVTTTPAPSTRWIRRSPILAVDVAHAEDGPRSLAAVERLVHAAPRVEVLRFPVGALGAPDQSGHIAAVNRDEDLTRREAGARRRRIGHTRDEHAFRRQSNVGGHRRRPGQRIRGRSRQQREMRAIAVARASRESPRAPRPATRAASAFGRSSRATPAQSSPPNVGS